MIALAQPVALTPPQYGWYPYPSIYAFPYICEKPQVLYACNQAIPPPTPPAKLCLPHDNDTGGRAEQHAMLLLHGAHACRRSSSV